MTRSGSIINTEHQKSEMIQSEIRKVIDLLEYETRRRELRKEFHEHGVKFFDKHGEGFIRNGVKHYCDT
jgi:UDP:flavonoid glycosyltransferase YjiC (YdhE family)